MAQRKHGLPQVAPSNLKELLRLLERGAVVDFSVQALRQEGITQAKHVHALLRALDFLDQRSHLTADIHACRKSQAKLATRLRDGIVDRCAAYASRLGDFSFVFDRAEDEAVRTQLKSCLAGEPSINQVVCSLMALRKEVRDRLGLSGRIGPRQEGMVRPDASPPASDQLAEAGVGKAQAPSNDVVAPDVAPWRRTIPASENGWRVDEVRDAQGALQSLQMHIRTPRGHVTVSARLERGDFGGVEVVRGR